MKFLEQFRSYGIPLDWPTIAAGWEGCGPYGQLISTEEVIAYAAEQLPNPPQEQLQWVTQLAVAEKDEREVISRALHQLAQGDSDTGVRKWRLLFLKELLPKLGSNPLHDLLALTDFWSSFDYPTDSPHIVQGQGNSITPEDYYTEANLQSILYRHQKWVQDEAKRLV